MNDATDLTSYALHPDDGVAAIARLKRRLYTVYLAVTTVAALLLLVFTSPGRDAMGAGVAQDVVLLLVLFSLTCAAALWARLSAVRVVEQAMYWVSYPAFLGGLVLAISQADGTLEQHAALHSFSLWLPIAVVWSFLAFGSARGLVAAFGFLATTAVVLTAVQGAGLGIEPMALAFAGQLAATGTIYVVVLYAFSLLLERQTAARSSAEVIAAFASKDPLTGLSNRLAFSARFEQARALARRSGRSLAVCFVDLDHFKLANDTFGHAGGDALLRGFAARLQGAVRESDTVARLGGDEFVVLAFVDDDQQASVLAAKLVDAQNEPYAVEGREMTLSCSVGLSLYPRDGEEIDALLEHADRAMYVAKSARDGRALSSTT
jgi:diguanylate cyclase (GGDEF)-like protein